MSHWTKTTTSKPKNRNAKVFGEVTGCKVGMRFKDRQECSDIGVHAPLRAGIHGTGNDGAYSVVLSFGYEDDEDHGDWFIYTGAGGRDTKGDKLDQMTGKEKWDGEQCADQEWVRGNKALQRSYETQRPVRVIRGSSRKGKSSRYAPASGYRYDGLYVVEKCLRSEGENGFMTCKFHFRGVPGKFFLPGKGSNTRSSNAKPVASTSAVRQTITQQGGQAKQSLCDPRWRDYRANSTSSAATPGISSNVRASDAPVRCPSPELPPIATLRLGLSNKRDAKDDNQAPAVAGASKSSPEVPYTSKPISLPARRPSQPKPISLSPRASSYPRECTVFEGTSPLQMIPIEDAVGTSKRRRWTSSDQLESEEDESDAPSYKRGKWASVEGKKKYPGIHFTKAKLDGK